MNAFGLIVSPGGLRMYEPRDISAGPQCSGKWLRFSKANLNKMNIIGASALAAFFRGA